MDIWILVGLILGSGVLSLAEMAVGASRNSTLAMLAEEGSAGAGTVLRFRQHPSRLLATTQLGITALAKASYTEISGGERQRVNFARVLAQLWPNPHAELQGCRYLFLDEPLTFLDIHHQISFMKKVRDLASSPDAVIVGVVHDLNLAARFADGRSASRQLAN